MKYTIIKSAVVASLFALPVTNAEAVCLDYWLKGPAACQEENPKDKNRILIKGGKNININVEKDQARMKYEEDLNGKIDVFLAGYGKPPREFAAFHLDPTLENAVRWVKKFNTEHERTMKIAVSWKQADQLYRQYKATGEILLPADSGVTPEQIKYLKQAFEGDATDLPKVKGFGVDLPGNWDEDRLSRNYDELDYKKKDPAQLVKEMASPMPVPYGTPDLMKQVTDRAIASNSPQGVKVKKLEAEEDEKFGKGFEEEKEESRSLFDRLTGSSSKKEVKKAVKKETKKQVKKGDRETLEISYYFSDKCPFCKQFKPNLQSAIAAYGKENIKLTCVDMTPGEKSPKHVPAGLKCKWRPILTGEMQQFGIEVTPSMIVKRGNSDALELLENYHETPVLVDYFINGPKN